MVATSCASLAFASSAMATEIVRTANTASARDAAANARRAKTGTVLRAMGGATLSEGRVARGFEP
mgnify:CR=1 FL=1